MATSKKHKDTPQMNGTALSKEEEILLNGNAKKDEAEKEDTVSRKEDFQAQDGGWGWVVCLASFWTNGTIFGILNTFGILYVKMLEEFDNGDKDLAFKTSLIGAFQIALTFFLSPVASIMVDRFGIRPTGFIGAFCATAGMLLSSFVRDIKIMYITYGVMLGMGSSLIYNPSLVILGHYFDKHLGVVNGLVSFGSSVFTIIYSFLLEETLETIGLFNTMRVLAGMLSLLMIGSLTWKPQYEMRHRELDHYFSTESLYQRASGIAKWVQKFLNIKIWKNKGYLVWAISLPIAFLGYFIPFVHLVKHTKDILPNANGEILVMCMGTTSGVSRLIFGKIADFPKVNRIRMQQIAFVVLGVATACIPFAKQFWILIVLTLTMGISDGCFICLLGPIAFDLLGPSGASQGLGMLLGIASIPMTIGPPVAGIVYDNMGSYNIAFWAAGIPPITAACLLFLIPLNKKAPTTRAISMPETHIAMSRENLDVIPAEEEHHSQIWRFRKFSENEALDSSKQNGHATHPTESHKSKSMSYLPLETKTDQDNVSVI